MANGLKLGELDPGVLRIIAMRLGDGCSENCISCGAYPPSKDRDDTIRAVTPIEVDEARIRQMLEREVEGPKAVVDGVRLRLVDLLARYVTTDVNQEPLNGDAFVHFMRLVKQLSGGKSRAVCISHGLRLNSRGEPHEDSARRLSEIVDMLNEQEDVFVLSLDMARSNGKFGQSEQNQTSYVETLDRLRPALRNGARITISIQGVDDSESPLFKGKAYELCARVKAELKAKRGWSDGEIAKLKLDERAWVGVGRSEILPGVNPKGECPVIPDNLLVTHTITPSQTGVVLNGVIDAVSGIVYAHLQDVGRGYNNLVRVNQAVSAKRAGKRSIDWGVWQEVHVNSDPVEDLSGAFNRRVMDSVLRRTDARGRRMKRALAVVHEAPEEDDGEDR